MKTTLSILALLFPFYCQAEGVYLNRIWYLEKDLFYVEINYNDQHDHTSHEAILPHLGDPLQTGETVRRKLPIAIANKYLSIPPDQKLSLFHYRNGNPIGLLEFIGIEYHENMIYSSFVAVFRVRDFRLSEDQKDAWFYCLSANASSNLSTAHISKVDPNTYQDVIKEKYGVEDRLILHTSSVSYGNMVFTLCAFYNRDYSSNSVLLATSDHIHVALKEILKEEYIMSDMIITPLLHEGTPTLIMEMGIPETDNNWTMIAVYNGESYELQSPDRLIKLTD